MSLELRIAVVVCFVGLVWLSYLVTHRQPPVVSIAEPPDGQPERRHDLPRRRRIVELETRWAWGAIAATAISVLALALVTIGYAAQWRQGHQLEQLVLDQQASRYRASLSACLDRRDDRAAIRDFVIAVSPELREAATRRFPTGTDCRAQARARTSTP